MPSLLGLAGAGRRPDWWLRLAVGCACLGAGLPARAQRPDNDGFQRRHGQMYIVRNGQTRPMLRDARLPTGVVVTKDGYVVDAQGRRTELREGQGCTLRGQPVAVVQNPAGLLTLAPPRAVVPSRSALTKTAVARRGSSDRRVRAVLAGLFREHHGKGRKGKHKKRK